MGEGGTMSDCIVEINNNMYRYTYDPDTQGMKYLGPVGDSAPLSEDQFEEVMSLVFKGSGKPYGFAMSKVQWNERKAILREMENRLRKKKVEFHDLGASEQMIMGDLHDEFLDRAEEGRISPPLRNESLEIYRLQELGLVEVYPYVNIKIGDPVPEELLLGTHAIRQPGEAGPDPLDELLQEKMAESRIRKYEPEPGRVAVIFTKKGREMMERHRKPYIKTLEEWEI